MSKPYQSVRRQLSCLLAEYRSIIERYAKPLEHQPLLAVRIAFRIEAVNFYLNQLDFWYETGDMQRVEETTDRARKNLEDLYLLLPQ